MILLFKGIYQNTKDCHHLRDIKSPIHYENLKSFIDRELVRRRSFNRQAINEEEGNPPMDEIMIVILTIVE